MINLECTTPDQIDVIKGLSEIINPEGNWTRVIGIKAMRNDGFVDFDTSIMVIRPSNYNYIGLHNIALDYANNSMQLHKDEWKYVIDVTIDGIRFVSKR